MSVNIACSVPKCANPVIGQCTGYKKTCGRYYCHEHSSDTLCADCAGQKAADEQAQLVYQDYVENAQNIERGVRSTFLSLTTHWQVVGILLILYLLFIAVLGPVDGPHNLLVIAALIYWFVKRGNWIREEGLKKAKEVSESKLGFLEFFEAWRKEKSKEKLANVLVVAGVIAAIGVAAAASESDYDRTRRAVRDEMNRN